MSLVVVLAFLVNTALLAFLTQRLLGVPVGWIRTLAVSVVITSGMQWFLTSAGQALGLVDADTHLVPGADPVTVTAVFLLLVAWGVALGIGALVLAEAVVPTGSVPSPVALLRELPARRRRARRYAALAAIAARHGLGGFLRRSTRLQDAPSGSALGRRLRPAFSEAGVTFVKLGQMLSTRPDLVGEDLARELAALQADNPPETWETVRRVLEAELGADWAGRFASFEHTPLAAASVGQVHRAELADGTAVVVKVQRPGAAAQVRADLDILVRMARWLERTTAWGRALGVRSLADGFAASLREELDYRVEAANAAAVAAARRPGSPVHVPAVHTGLSTARVLVMERVAGTPLSRAGALDGVPVEERRALADGLLRAVLDQMLGSGVFHADLHGGNVLMEPLPDGGHRLALLDFGAVGRLDRGAREALGRLVAAVDRSNTTAVVDALCELLDPPADLDDRLLQRRLGEVVSRAVSVPGAAGATTDVFQSMLDIVVRHGFAVPPQVAATFRALGALEGTLRALDPGLDVVAAGRAAGQEQLQSRLGPEGIRAALEDQLLTSLPQLARLPRRVDAIAAAVQSGEAQVRVRWLAHPEDRAFVSGIVDQLVTTVLAAVLAVCGVWLVVADGGPALTADLTLGMVVGATLFLFAFVLAARSLAVVFQHGRDRR